MTARAFAAIAMAGLVVIAGCGGSRNAASDTSSARRLIVGSYRVDGPGMFRRIIISSDRTVKYDVWRATPSLTVQHLHFDLIPPAQHPIKSERYRVRSEGQECDSIGLRIHPDTQGFRHGQILVFRYGNVEQPLDGTGHPTTQAELRQDQVEVGRIASWVRILRSYSSIDEKTRDQLLQFVPWCGKHPARPSGAVISN